MAPETVGGYVLTTKFNNAGGGQCQWAFAEKGGQSFFIKRFLQPTFPLPDGPGSAETKERKRAACEVFEKRHRDMMAALGKLSKGGSVIVARDFFRDGAKYYKVTEKVDVSPDVTVSTRPLEDRLLLMAVVAHSLAVLHRAKIVHGDLKPANVLLKRTDKGVITAKLIDFDDSYISGAPPAADVLVGDFVYYSPETHLYILGEGQAEELQTAADIFALGILFAEYLTGQRPRAGAGADTCAVGVLKGEALQTGVDSIDWELNGLIRSMLSRSPEDRPNVQQVFSTLKSITKEIKSGGPRPGAGPSEAPPPAGGSRLKGSLLDRRLEETPAKPEVPPAKPTRPTDSAGSSRLKGSLVDRSKPAK